MCTHEGARKQVERGKKKKRRKNQLKIARGSAGRPCLYTTKVESMGRA